jgi:GT2 family glycosyltransferase
MNRTIEPTAVEPRSLMNTPRPSVAVAICTRERPDQLRRLLHSLAGQVGPLDELLVVDNAPVTSRTRELVEQGFPDARYVVEPAQGLDFARNRALRESRAEVVAYIDDDAVASTGWVQGIAAVFAESPRIAVCTGKVEAWSVDSEGARLFEANGGFARGDQRIHLPPGAGAPPPGLPRPLIAWSIAVGSGVSMAVRRAVAERLGGFDEALDMGVVLPGGGDIDMLWRALEAGYEVVYEPAVHARHEHRRDLAAAQMQILEHNRALIATLTKAAWCAPGLRKLPVLAFLGWRLCKPVLRLLRRAIGRDPLPAALLGRLCLSTWRGLIAYPAAVNLAAERASHERSA